MKYMALILTLFTFLFPVIPDGSAQQSSTPQYLYSLGIKDSLSSEVLKEQRDFWVHIPQNAKPYERFPVVYVLDGGEQMKALATVYHYYWGNYLPRMILVGISNRKHRTRHVSRNPNPNYDVQYKN